MIPGEIRTRPGSLELNAGREHRSAVVVNGGDRPIQVGSHLHFPDANPALRFDRQQAHGFRLDIPAGTSVRFEPGVSRTVELVALGGRGHVAGLQIRDVTHASASAQREPRQVVPFGTPGSDVQPPGRVSPAPVRVSEQGAQDSDPTEKDS